MRVLMDDGPQVGEAVPSFSLADRYGAVRDLQWLMGPGGGEKAGCGVAERPRRPDREPEQG